MKNLLVTFLALMAISFSSCTSNLENQINKSVTDLTSAADAINANAANTVGILNGLKKDYPDEIKGIINNDIDRLIKTTEFSAGAEVRCETDFFAKRIRHGLQNTIIKLKNILRQNKGETPLSLISFPPTFCNCTPEQIDLNETNTKPLKIYGYDFEDFRNIKILAVKYNGISRNISKLLARPTDYMVTLATNEPNYFIGFNKIEFYYNKQNVYSMLIIPKSPKICNEEDWTFAPTPQTIEIGSVQCGGDSEFGGNVYMSCTGELKLSDDKRTILCHMKLTANEKGGDTRGCWEKDYPLYTAKNRYIIKSILTPVTYHFAYEDDDEENDIFSGDGFVKSAVFKGDHQGKDVGVYTGASLTLSNIVVTLMEKGNDCVSKEDYLSAHANEVNLRGRKYFFRPTNINQARLIREIDMLEKK